MRNILVVYGTRPEAIKVAPLIAALRRLPGCRTTIAVTGQHRVMLDQVNRVFDLTPDFDLDISKPGQSLTDISVGTLHGLAPILNTGGFDAVVVQGDTTTSTFAAIAAFYAGVPVVHVEAGLRTADLLTPFPEEANRRITTRLAALHLAPTSRAKDALLAESVREESVLVSGNTVIDALETVISRHRGTAANSDLALLEASDRPVALLTTHRRESWGEPMRRVARAVGELADAHRGVTWLVPMHLNPMVREALRPELEDRPNVVLTEPLDYVHFCRAMARACVVLTDSGGAQEEAPSLGRPVIVLRDSTERPEGVDAGVAHLVGTDIERIVEVATPFLQHPRQPFFPGQPLLPSPYGDGRAADRSAAAIGALLGIAERLPDFEFAPASFTA